MGIDYTTHIGPYFECKTNKIDFTQVRRACDDKTCPKYNKISGAKFCGTCGRAIGVVPEVIKMRKVNTQELRDEVNDEIYWPAGDEYMHWSNDEDIDIWLGNRYRKHEPRERSWSFDPREGFQYTEITSEKVKEEIAEFAEQYKQSLHVLQKHYGVDNVRIKWGLVHTIW